MDCLFWNIRGINSREKHLDVTSNSSQLSYFLTTVYASNNASARTILWSNLRSLAQSIGNDQWIIGGDFNEVHFSHEKIGGRGAYTRRMTRFNEYISDCHLQDLKALGSHFSWSNQQQFRIACKLDRILVNLTSCSNANNFVQYLAQGLSDHTALKVSVQPSIPSVPRPFKYFQAWESHSQFSTVILRAWQQQFCGSPIYILVKKLQHLKIVLKDWNKEVFGPVQYCLQNSRQRLELAQLASLNDPSNRTFINEDSTAKEEYLSMLRREESFLRQKSWQTWLMEGDRNSKFFYASIKARIAKNTLRKVQLDDGTIFEDPSTIQSHAINYYRNLLNAEYQCEENCSKQHAVKWSSVCRPKVEGGLGLKLLRDWNSAAMGVRFWEIATNHPSLWAQWIEKKYLRRCSIWATSPSTSSSVIWRKILKVGDWIRHRTKYVIFNGESIHL
ncbi:putative ribonuclease H protein [Acorus calamus]|uniref:Ribonuclease H protein n=1 Tax=Acorus calamus TaxID=4465 RepID=A0AAV9CAH5_ACOCL|nr:putative ribonuclease H protein [Acorus calamus]